MYAKIYWLTAEDGGRTAPIVPDKNRNFSYWANTQKKDKNAWSVGVYFQNAEQVLLGTIGKYEIKFLVSEAEIEFRPGNIIYICEGTKVIGNGVIL